MIQILITQGPCFVFFVGTADQSSITERNPPLPAGGAATNWLMHENGPRLSDMYTKHVTKADVVGLPYQV